MMHDEEWLKKKGWRKVYGYKILLNQLPYDEPALVENLEQVVQSVNYYTNDEQKFEHIAQAIAHQEVIDEMNGVIEIDGL
ncbi:MAG: hypothetical protein MUP55_00690 [Candidatus Aenigmarchaeota archaeon]|nr:hypothetical protein [Candidatus Aenigmarchaeota archaeon]